MTDTWRVPTAEPATTADPAALIAEQATRHPGLRILALGPLTSVAIALRHRDVVATRPDIVVSGGAVNEPGNMPTNGGTVPAAEWNIGVDPVAADEVLRSGLARSWVAVDASNDVPADVWFVNALASSVRGPAGDAALAFLQANPALSRGGYYFWDPLAAVAMTTPKAVTNQPSMLGGTYHRRRDGSHRRRSRRDAGHRRNKADPTAFATAMLRAYGPVDGSALAAYSPGASDVRVTRELGAFRLDRPATLPAGDTTIGLEATTGGAYAVVVGRLTQGRTLADVHTAIAQGVTSVPPWFEVEATIEVPAGSARPGSSTCPSASTLSSPPPTADPPSSRSARSPPASRCGHPHLLGNVGGSADNTAPHVAAL